MTTKSQIQAEHDEFAREFEGGLRLPEEAGTHVATEAAAAGIKAASAGLPLGDQDASVDGGGPEEKEDADKKAPGK